MRVKWQSLSPLVILIINHAAAAARPVRSMASGGADSLRLSWRRGANVICLLAAAWYAVFL